MKSLFILFFSIFVVSSSVQSADIDSVRFLYFEEWVGECGAEKLVDYLEEINKKGNELLKVYKGAALATTANCEFMPWNKLKNFNNGKSYIESAVNNDPENLEIRFIRFTIQSNIPSLLNYDNIEEDKDFILKKLLLQSTEKDKSEMNIRIIDYMKNSSHLTLEEQDDLISKTSKG